MAFVNPHITKKRSSEIIEEGCLSIPGVTVKVKRPKKIFVSYFDEHNHKHGREFEGLLARVIQHETDHLNGTLIVDYAGWRQKLKLKKQLAEIRKETKNIS